MFPSLGWKFEIRDWKILRARAANRNEYLQVRIVSFEFLQFGEIAHVRARVAGHTFALRRDGRERVVEVREFVGGNIRDAIAAT